MKKIFTCLTFTALLVSFTSASGIDDVIRSLQNGGASAISRYFDENVDITLIERSNRYSKSQAQMVLRDFLNNHPVLGFELGRRGESAGREFCTGILKTTKGNFRATMVVRQRSGRSLLQEIRIEKI